MAEQCIVCLDTLLHASEPPPPPLAGDSAAPTSSTANASSTAAPAVLAATTTAPSTGKSGPSTAPAASGQNGHSSHNGHNGHNSNSTGADASAAAPNGNGSLEAYVESHDDDNVAVIQVCGHTLHDTCLREWTTKANSCPICRQTFHLVDVYDKIEGKKLSTYTVEDKKQVAEFDPQAWLDEYPEVQDDEVSTPCPVCNLSDHEEVLLLCDGCDTPYHTHCIGLESVPDGSWFCMECVDLFGDAVSAPASQAAPTGAGAGRQAGRRTGTSRVRNDFFPRTRHTMRRARRRARSDEWQGAWGQITGRIWDALNIDLDHDEDEALEEFRRVERLRDNERREFERWQERLDIARRLGAQHIFERNIPSAILQHASRHTGAAQPSSSSLNSRGQIVAAQQTQEERRAWGDFERARDCDQTTPSANPRKRKSRSVTASPIEPPPEPERKLKRPRTRRIGAPSGDAASSAAAAASTDRATATASATVTPVSATSPPPTAAGGPANSASASSASPVTAAIPAASSPAQGARSPPANGDAPSFLSSLLKEVEMSAPSDDENIRSLFGDPPPPPPPPPPHTVDPSSPIASSPAASAHNSPRAMSTTPPPQRALRPSSPTLLSSHILPVYPPANYSPTRSAVSPSSASAGGGGGGDNSDSESNSNGNQHRSPSTVEIRQPRPRRMPAVPAARSQDTSPSRHALPLEMKESISSIVRTALSPHWKSSQLTAEQYAAINRDVSRKLYEEVTNPATVDAEARKLWEQKASREVAQAVADLKV